MATVAGGLEGVVAATTRLSQVRGDAGELVIAGYAVEELAPRARFEEVVHLLWEGRLPSASELEALRSALAGRRALPEATRALLRAAAACGVAPMDALLMATATLALDDRPEPGAADRAATARAHALRLVAALPTIVGSYERLRRGLAPVAPSPQLGHAAHFLQQLEGAAPTAGRERALETYLNTVCDHGLNASTFAARVIVSTRSDLVSAVTGALGALKGPLHGGAPGPALELILEVGDPDRAPAVITAKLARGERLMGFGHRVYRVRDPRAEVLAAAAERLADAGGDARLLRLARAVETAARSALARHKPGRRLDTNVEFYTALLLHGLGLPSELFTPAFAIGRVAGWTAHALEQQAGGRLIRPESEYAGPHGLRFVPLAQREVA